MFAWSRRSFGLIVIVGFVARSYVPYGNLFFPPAVAVADIALVLLIFKGDLRIS